MNKLLYFIHKTALFLLGICAGLFAGLTALAVPHGYRFPEQTVHVMVGAVATVFAVIGLLCLLKLNDWVMQNGSKQAKAKKLPEHPL